MPTSRHTDFQLFGLGEQFAFHPSSQGHRDPQAKRIARRLAQRFEPAERIERESGFAPRFGWTVEAESIAEDRTAHKLLLRNASGAKCETVALMPQQTHLVDDQLRRRRRATACISSQPGCGVGCPFCATGELGYRGNLTAEEIAEQVYWAGLTAERYDRDLRNIVFMGMGEPLHNLEQVTAAIRLLCDGHLFAFPQRRITLSTVGVPGAMLKLASEFPQLRFALSLHAVDESLRRQLVPRAVSDMRQLRETIKGLNQIQHRQPVWLEVVLFDRLNDQPAHADALIAFCEGLRVEINLIPYNTAAAADRYRASPLATREAFAQRVRAAGIRATMRTSLGSDAAAACGQLQAASPYFATETTIST